MLCCFGLVRFQDEKPRGAESWNIYVIYDGQLTFAQMTCSHLEPVIVYRSAKKNNNRGRKISRMKEAKGNREVRRSIMISCNLDDNI